MVLSDYSTCCTNACLRVLTRSVHQVHVYAFGAPTTRLRVWCTPEALTNQGGRTNQYTDHVACFNTKDSHYLNKHIILHVFRARGYDSNCIIKLIQTYAYIKPMKEEKL